MLTKVKKIQIRYYPPGINIIYSKASLGSSLQQNIEKQLNLYSLNPHSFYGPQIQYPIRDQAISQEINKVIDDLILQCKSEIGDIKYYKNQLEYSLFNIIQKHNKLTEKIRNKSYTLKNSIKVHAQPLTNCLFNKSGNKFATASYDRTCRIWDSETGSLLTSIKGHRNAVFCIDFSKFSQRQMIATGSLDHTAIISSIDGINLWNLKEHEGQLTSIKFNPNGVHLLTGSFDHTIKVWDLQKGRRVMTLQGHTGQVIKIDQNYIGDLILSCSFDHSAKIWDLRTGKMSRNLYGHSAQVNASKFQYTSELCATASNDKSCILWDVGTGKQLTKFQDHSAQIYDLDFSRKGEFIATCSADMSTKVYNTNTLACHYTFKGHKGEITRVIFINNGMNLLTTGYDGIGRVWDLELGKNVCLLQGHQEQIFSCDVDYQGNRIITCSKDNICNLWQLSDAKSPLK